MNTTMAAAHRRTLLDALGPGSVAVLPTGPERVRSRDTHFKFRPDSDFWYLTAFPEPDAVLVLGPDLEGGPVHLFVRPRDEEMEIWHGRRAGVEGAKALYGADVAHAVDDLDTELPKLLKGAEQLVYRTGMDVDFDRKLQGWLREMADRTRDGVTGPAAIIDPGAVLHEMRLFKTDDELAVLRRAAAITDEAHRAAMATLRGDLPEYEIEAVVDGTFRRRGGWGPGYPSICAGGSNACVLHYTTNHETVGEGDLLLLDAGCEVEGYTADVTRTFPASGTFTPAQRELYEVVLAAQLAALDHVRPGNSFVSVHETCLAKLVEGMLEIELLSGTAEEVIESGDYRRYFMHRTGHWLGIDVHDVGRYHVDGDDGAKQSRPLEPGMVLTVEPGLYVSPDDELAPERFRGLGIRIEDDVAVSADGHENLTAAIPKSVDEVEAACAR